MKFIRSIIAFFAIPAVIAASYTLLSAFLSFAGTSGKEYVPFWIGVFCYIVFQIVFYKPMRTYVFGHELTHAFAGILSGAKIKKFKVGKESGHVVMTKDNIWITLAPYFFPIYTFAVIIIYLMLGWVIDIIPLYPYYLFLMGLSISFHIALTIYILGIGQSDLKVYGVFFSYILIIIINIIVFTLLMALAFPQEIDVAVLFKEMYGNIKGAYQFTYDGISRIYKAFGTMN